MTEPTKNIEKVRADSAAGEVFTADPAGAWMRVDPVGTIQ